MPTTSVNNEDEEQRETDSPEDLMTTVDQFVTDDMPSPITAEIFDFCDNELFPSQTLTSSEAASCSNCCPGENSYYSASMSLPLDVNFGSTSDAIDINTAPTTKAASVAIATGSVTDNSCSNFSMSFDPQDDMDNDISASINFSPCVPFSVPPYLTSASQENQFNISQIQREIAPSDTFTTDGVTVTQYPNQSIGPLMATHPLQPVFEDECLSSVPSFECVNHSSSTAPPCTLLDLSLGPYLLDNLSPTLSAADSFVGSNLFMGSEIPQYQTLGYQEDCNSYFSQRGFYNGDAWSLCSETDTPWIVPGAGVGLQNQSITSEISNMEDTIYKVGKLSAEQRKEKIHRYMKKRNERNFSKKIKYACRKTLADSRPRVRGRFAKNDEYGCEHSFRGQYSHHEDDEDDDITVKEEDELLSSSDIFSHISGVNSFNYNFPVQSWT